ncbi:MAG: M23 family metallopeptidase [Bacteroidales bacterium]|nr:M23 family metallopeptidase [Bacteroidales bacterium]
MLGRKQYIFNKETLSYEIVKPTLKRRILRCCIVFGLGFLCFAAYSWIYSEVFSLKTLKTKILESRNEELLSQIKGLNQKLDEKHRTLMEIEMRDNIVYRPIFGMEEIPSEVRDAGFGGVDRYSHLEHFEHSDILISSAMRLDILSKKASVQSRSFDEVSLLAKRAGDMASCVPSIFPVSTHPRNRLGSRFGYRSDPFTGSIRMHKGVDISGKRGEPIYATGDGIVVEVCYNFFGYGNQVIVDHGFGYKTRYAHLHEATVKRGQRVIRGDQVGKMGTTGRSKGVHLHYEVIYKGKAVNPCNYFDHEISPEEYQSMILAGKDRR